MDSLLANYASSDEGEEEQQISISNKPFSSISNKFSHPTNSNLNPKPSSSLFSKLPPPKSSLENSSSSSSSLFSSLPQPKSQTQTNTNQTKPKKVIQFTLPINPNSFNEDDEEEEEETIKPVKESSLNNTAAKALSSMLPAPKNSLCLAPTASSRKHVFESHGSPLYQDSFQNNQESSNLDQQNASFDVKNEERSGFEGYGLSGYENYNMNNNWSNENYNADNSYNVEQGVSGYENYNANESVDYGYGVGGYEKCTANNWNSENNVAGQVPVVHEMARIVGKRKKNDVPAEFVEVNQAELMKNRPREDQVKATGIAFGPAYQPVSTSKGKPSKLQKRKHQIGSLYFDMKQKEMELAERRSKGFLTKSETQAKYGW